MSRLVDANEVVKAILAERDKIPSTVPAATYELGTEKPYHVGNHMRGGIRKALRCIEQAPTIDAVPVVRCRECKWWQEDDDIGHCDNPDGLDNYAKPDDFCSYGERKEGADNA